MTNHPNRGKFKETLSTLMADPHTKRVFIAVGVHVADTDPLTLE